MHITSIQKKGKYFTVITEQSSTVYKFHPDIIPESGIYEGAVIDSGNWDEILQKNDFRFCWESALRMLSLRAHCEQDIKNKLRKKGFKSSAVSKVMSECKRLALIDDAKFAKEYTRELKENGDGLKMIRLKLFRKGVSGELIDKEFEESFTEEDEMEAAQTALRKKMPSLKRETDPLKRKEKFFRYMSSKGFSYEIIQKISPP